MTRLLELSSEILHVFDAVEPTDLENFSRYFESIQKIDHVRI